MGVVAVAILGAATGCARSEASEAPVTLPAKSISQWRMPLDEYLSPSWDPTTYATQLLAKECMDATQYDWPLPALTVDPPTGESWNSVGRKLFTPELAQKYGYGNSPEHVLPASEKEAIDAFTAAANNLDASGAAALDRCWSRAAEQLRAQTDPTEFAQSLQSVGQPSAKDQTRLTSSKRKWQQCMAPAGIADLPANPTEMDPTAFLPAGEQSAPVDSVKTVASPREREVAVMDANCQQSSGWASAAYASEWNLQAEQVRTHADELQRYRTQTVQQHDRAMKVIAEHSPKR